MENEVGQLLKEIRSCTICEEFLPLGPRPIVQFSTCSKILIIGQAPGQKVHNSGIPWDDASGNNLRDWMGIDKKIFYDEDKIALVPMGFCYPGKGKSGDLPPRPECEEAWHERILNTLPNLKLTLLVGQYAQNHYLEDRKDTLTETVRNWESYIPEFIPLPHPSPRNNIWKRKNPWFEADVLPHLKEKVREVFGATE